METLLEKIKQEWLKICYLKSNHELCFNIVDINKTLKIKSTYELDWEKKPYYNIRISIDDCIINTTLEKYPWGGSWNEMKKKLPKNFATNATFYHIDLSCENYAGTNSTCFIVYVLFYILKLLNNKKTIITSDDGAEHKGKNIARYVLENFKSKNVNLFVKTKNLYYERFGFIYPEKREMFKKYLAGEYVQNGQPFYINLNNLSLKQIKNMINKVKFKF